MGRRLLWWPSPWPGTYSLAACPSWPQFWSPGPSWASCWLSSSPPQFSWSSATSPGVHKHNSNLLLPNFYRLFREEYFDTVLQVNLTVLLVQATLWVPSFFSTESAWSKVFQLHGHQPKLADHLVHEVDRPVDDVLHHHALPRGAGSGRVLYVKRWVVENSALPTLSTFPDSRSKVEPMDKPELASSIWSLKTEECFLCIKYQLLATLCHTQITLIAFRRLGLMGMKVTSTLVLPIGYLVFVITW